LAITSVLAYSGNGPSADGQILADSTLSGNFARTLVGKVTLTLDGAATTATINYIDGSAALGFAPSALFWSKIGGTESTGAVVKIVDAGDGKTAVATLSAAGTNANTLIYSLMICK
jgi:hypothetical protein